LTPLPPAGGAAVRSAIISAMGEIDGPRPYSGTAARDELRWRRSRAILSTALDILTTDGHEALTMQRIADTLECGVATIYRLFPSKDALIGELQLDALALLRESWEAGLDHLDQTMHAAAMAERDSALTRALAAGWFWVAAERRFPHEVEMSRRVVVDRATEVPEAQAVRILTACLDLFERGRACLDAAVHAGALAPGDGGERGVVLVSTIFGIAVTIGDARWDLPVMDRDRLAREAVAGHLVTWGAAREAVEAAEALLLQELDDGWVAPVVERTTPERAG
jgi:AcrR family transcriptional regulator